MERIRLLKNQLVLCNKLSNRDTKSINLTVTTPSKSPKIISSAFDYFNFEQFLTKEEREYLTKFRLYLKKHIESQINPFIEKKEFPRDLILNLLKSFPGIMGLSLKGYDSAGFSKWLSWCILLELARCDLSLATFFLVNGGELIMKTISEYGSVKQKEFYLAKMNSLEIIGSFCLTEPEYGSDASNLKTSVKEEGDGQIILNGIKRWIGNASIAGVIIVWARNERNKNVEGYLVDPTIPGVDIKIIEGKLSTRGVTNCEITFTNVKISKENKLEKSNDFKTGTAKMLLGSRLCVAWLAVGACIGAYDRVIDYCSKRTQFGKSLTSFQLIQDKLARIMGNTQAMLYFTKRASELYLQEELSIGRAGLVKAWCTHTARETLLIAREALGGNGVLIENNIMKTMLDLESLHTYEGTADINLLVCAKELTGISAFK